ncbi:hypothetical protein [Microbispora bryophytorum]|uniref:hypothetical protein n=1 Tax=Microbispora bryophytorum TaxID=1460882 RepID=UPI0033C29FA8
MGTFAVDFDGPIHAYREGWKDGTIYDEPTPGALEGLRALMAEHAVFIHTSREVEQVMPWLESYGFDVTADDRGLTFWNERGQLLVTNRKLPAVAYLDDRAVRFTTWSAALDELLPGRRAEPADHCTEMTCPHHGERNRAALATRRAAEQPPCEWFVWIGQPYTSCDRCGQPAWEHRGEEVPDRSNPFDDEPPGHREWKPGQADRIRAAWGGNR